MISWKSYFCLWSVSSKRSKVFILLAQERWQQKGQVTHKRFSELLFIWLMLGNPALEATSVINNLHTCSHLQTLHFSLHQGVSKYHILLMKGRTFKSENFFMEKKTVKKSFALAYFWDTRSFVENTWIHKPWPRKILECNPWINGFLCFCFLALCPGSLWNCDYGWCQSGQDKGPAERGGVRKYDGSDH